MPSASGETPVSLHLARRAADAGAHILAVTTHEVGIRASGIVAQG